MAEQKTRPNIIFIFTDQHRLSAVGAYGPTPCKTPNIDTLADDGVKFEYAYTTCPVCSPARATVMTGQYPHTHGILSNVHNLGSSVHELEDRPSLLSRRLESAGYSLGYSGKWHLGSDADTAYGGSNKPSLPRNIGFEGQNFPGHGNGGHRFPEYREYLSRNGFVRHLAEWTHPTPRFLPAGKEECPIEATVPYFLAQNTINMIDEFRKRGRPFFIWHNFWGPHGPYYAPAEFADMYRDVDIPEWPNYRWPSRMIPGPHHNKISPLHEELSWEAWATLIRYYYAFTSLIDAQIGRILDHLRSSGILENTLVIFTADHGETLGSHGGLCDKGWHHFEETHRIPLIMRFPGAGHRGRVIEQFASLADIYPTILDTASMEGAPGEPPKAPGIHGCSLLPLIEGTAASWRESVVTEFGGVNQLACTQRTIRRRNIKYGYNCCNEDELYDLDSDPTETVNLIRDPLYRETADRMRTHLIDWMEETRDPALSRTREMFSYHLDDLKVRNHPYR
jgi:arylsulfatase A-like enzyme